MCSLLEGWRCPFCNGRTGEGGGWGAGEEGAEDRGVKDDAGAGDVVRGGYIELVLTSYYSQVSVKEE